MEHFGFISLIPALCVLICALITKRTFESLIFGAIIGFIILEQDRFFSAFVDASLTVMGNPTIGWIILVCGLFGSLIALLVKSGGALAFAEYISLKVKTKKGALLATWFLGLLIFIDDYLNALTVSSSMQKVTDKYKTSREYLSYIVDSTAAPVCVLVPLSTWAIYVSGLLEEVGVAEQGEGLSTYLQIIPYMFYALIAIFVVLLTILGVIPKWGPMKKAELRAEQEGICIPEGSEKLSIVKDEDQPSKHIKYRIINFFIPLGVLIAYTVYSEIDVLQGVIFALGVSFLLFLFQRLMTISEFFESFFSGFKSMIYPLAIVFASFILVEVNESLGLTNFVIEVVTPIMNGAMLPVIAFITMAFVAFATGSFWGVYAISLPIIIPLADAVGANMYLSIGAIISAGAFGSHACPFGDSTVLSSAGSGCDNMQHVLTQLPYVLLSAGLASIGYLIFGYII